MSPPAMPAKTLARGAAHLSKRLIASYVFDWICILGIAAVGGGFNKVSTTSKRAFALQDPSLSYPNHPDTVSVGVLLVVSIIAPAVITLVLSFLFVPGGAAPKGTPSSLVWRRKLWEWNTAWMGLGLALASAFMITEGLKDLAGKPRPHLLAVCDPDVDNFGDYQVGGLGKTLDGAVPIMVDYRICRNQDYRALRNMFASWPSGHSSFAWAGLLYLSFWLSAKFAVNVPYLGPLVPSSHGRYISTFGEPSNAKSVATATTTTGRESEMTEYSEDREELLFRGHTTPPRNQQAAPPVYLLIFVFVPIGTAAFIAVSRWFDYHHHGFDIISGSLLGIFTSWFSFRYYHLPIRRGAGWSWGARNHTRAFWLGVGRDTYVGEEGWESRKYAPTVIQENRDVQSSKNTGIDTQMQPEAGPSAV